MPWLFGFHPPSAVVWELLFLKGGDEMAILAECPICHNKQAVKNKVCKCGQNMDTAKRSKKVKFWIQYRVNGKQRKEYVGFSIEEAKDADGKRRAKNGRIASLTFCLRPA
jgi:hypothetical protein